MPRSTDLELGFPFQLDTRGRAADPGFEQHVRDMIEMLLFTAPGERLNRPDFGSGLLQLVFSPNSSEEASIVQHLTQAALQKWLGDVITVQSLDVDARGSELDLKIEYSVKGLAEVYVATFELRDLPWQI